VRGGACLLLVLVASPAWAQAQRFEVTVVAGYRFGGGNLNTNALGDFEVGANVELDDAASFGIHLGHRFGAGEVEMLYARQGTFLRGPGRPEEVSAFPLAVETWQLGGSYLFRHGERVVPYVGLGVGLTRLLPEPAALVDETRFSVSLAAGTRFQLARQVGLRVEARAFFTVFGADSFCFGNACGVGTSQLMSQVDLRAGLSFAF
jgi:opacity protein-like surface antigen